WGLVPLRLSVTHGLAGRTFRIASGLFTHLAVHTSDRLVLQSYFDVLRNIGVVARDFSKEVVQSAGSDDKVASLLGGAGRPLVGIAVSSANKLKQLRAAVIAQTIASLRRQTDASVILIGGAQDRGDVANVLTLLPDTARIID